VGNISQGILNGRIRRQRPTTSGDLSFPGVDAQKIEDLFADVLIRRHKRKKTYIISGKIRANVVLTCIFTGLNFTFPVDKSFKTVVREAPKDDVELTKHRTIEASEEDDGDDWFDDVIEDGLCDVGEIVSQYLLLELPVPAISSEGLKRGKDMGIVDTLDEETSRDMAMTADEDGFTHDRQPPD